MIGFTSFGGMSMIPLISDEMISHHWMTIQQVSDIVAIAEMTPGALGLNCATFAGICAAGIPGAIAATLGVLTPAFTVCAAVAIFFNRFKQSNLMQYALVGIRPVCVGMVIGVIIMLSRTNYIGVAGGISPTCIGIAILDMALLTKWKFSIPKVIVISGVLGVVLFHILKLV